MISPWFVMWVGFLFDENVVGLLSLIVWLHMMLYYDYFVYFVIGYCGHFLHCLTNNNLFFVVVHLIRDIGLQSSLLLMYFPLYLCRYRIGGKKIAFVGLLELK